MKLQTETISYLLIFILAITLISTIMFYFLPYIRKSQDETKVNLIYNRLFGSKDSLIEAIKRAILTGEQTRIDTGFDVTWNITTNSIEVKFYSSVSPFLDNDQWVFIEGCNKQNCSFGFDPFYVIEGKSKKLEDVYEITYRLRTVQVIKDEKSLTVTFSSPKNFFTSKMVVVVFDNFDPKTNSYTISIS